MVAKYLTSYSYHLFGNYFKNRRSNYFELRQDLLKSRLNISYDSYLSLAVLCSLCMTLVGLIFAIVIVSIFGAPDITLTRSIFTDLFAGFSQYKNISLKILSVIGSVIVFGGGTYIAFLNYPKII